MSVVGVEIDAGSRAHSWCCGGTGKLTLAFDAKFTGSALFATSAAVVAVALCVHTGTRTIGFVVEAGTLAINTNLGTAASVVTGAAVVGIFL